MIVPQAEEASLVNLAEIAEMEVFILKRMKEFTLGDHASLFKGSGFHFVGQRDWEPGDRASSIDWAQSSLTNFSPLVVREFEQNSTAPIIALADGSLSTRCGTHATSVRTAIARSVAALGLSAALCQDAFGLLVFDRDFQELAAARPRTGKAHVVHCIDLFEQTRPAERLSSRQDIESVVSRHLRRTSLVALISDFLFADAPGVIKELSRLNAVHDVMLMIIDVRFAYQLPSISAGWIETFDVETGTTRVMSRRELGRLADRVGEWQSEVMRLARDADLDIVRIGIDRWEMETALVEFVAERRLRKI